MSALGDVVVRRRWAVLVAWVVLVGLGFTVGGSVFSRMTVVGGSSSAESVRGWEVLGEAATTGPRVLAVVDEVDPTDADVRAQVTVATADLVALEGVASAVDPYGPEGQALVMNVLSLGASFGALVLGFQEGWLAGPLGVEPADGLQTWVPVLVFVFAFGLSMDYEVFLLSRIKELVDEGHDSDTAVALGLQRSGRIITSAALLLVIVFAGFAAGEMAAITQLGLAMAVAVAVDATLVRCLLVPATMTLLGQANWWAPAPLRRLHERFGVSEHAPVPVPVPSGRRPDEQPAPLPR